MKMGLLLKSEKDYSKQNNRYVTQGLLIARTLIDTSKMLEQNVIEPSASP